MNCRESFGRIYVTDEKGDHTVIINNNIASCSCHLFKINRWCEHLQYLKDNNYKFITQRLKDPFQFMYRYKNILVEALNEHYNTTGE